MRSLPRAIFFVCSIALSTRAQVQPGLVTAWGVNAHGQVGDGTAAPRLTAVSTSLTNAIAVAAGNQHSLALLADGTVKAWGANSSGQLGLGDRNDRLVPTQVLLNGAPVEAAAVAAGGYHSLAIMPDGTVRSWGLNTGGQLGDGTTTDRLSPAAVLGLNGVVAIAGGESHSLALKSDGSVWAWGMNNVGQLGDGTPFSRFLPTRVIDPADATGFLTGVTAIAAGGGHSLALKADGTLRAWGRNDSAQVGSTTELNVLTPIVPNLLTSVAAVAAGQEHTLALTTSGEVWAWGGDTYGQLGDRPPLPPPGGSPGSGERPPAPPPDSGPGAGERPPIAPPGSTSVPIPINGLTHVTAIATRGAWPARRPTR